MYRSRDPSNSRYLFTRRWAQDTQKSCLLAITLLYGAARTKLHLAFNSLLLLLLACFWLDDCGCYSRRASMSLWSSVVTLMIGNGYSFLLTFQHRHRLYCYIVNNVGNRARVVHMVILSLHHHNDTASFKTSHCLLTGRMQQLWLWGCFRYEGHKEPFGQCRFL